MFATLTYNKGDAHDEVTVVPGSARCFGGRKPARLACTLCRAKKVKCTGEEGGCARCKVKRIKCVYPASNERGSYAKSISVNSRRSPENDSKSNESNSSSGNDVSSSPTIARKDLAQPSRSLGFDMDFSCSAFSPDMQIDADMGEQLLSLTSQPSSTISYSGSSFFDLDKDIPMDSFDIVDDFDDGIFPEPNELDLWMPADNSIPQSPSQTGSSTPHEVIPGPTTHSTTTKHILSSLQDSLSDTQPCSCSQSAVQMLEELERKVYNATTLSTDVVLNDQKLSLSRFHPWLTCESCPTPKATSMLLALIIERLSVHLEKGVAHFIHDLQQQDNSHIPRTTITITEKAEKHNSMHSRAGAGLGSIGEFQIESRQEYYQVMRVLLVTKCQELVFIVETLETKRIKDIMLFSTKRRTKRILSELLSFDGKN